MNGDLCLACDSLLDYDGICWSCFEYDEDPICGYEDDEWYEDGDETGLIYIPYSTDLDPALGEGDGVPF